ncbi:hypothetical protein P152DRAFT_420489, partial [Eremomyces bilateralis CBS 781.70]
MRRVSHATPCPPPSPPGSAEDGGSITAYIHEESTTGNVEFTKEVREQFHKAKPRRPPPGVRKSILVNAGPQEVNDDPRQRHLELPTGNSHARRTSLIPKNRGGRRTSILAQPAQKIPGTSRLGPLPVIPAANSSRQRRPTLLPDHLEQDEMADPKAQPSLRNHIPLKKAPRRRTIYVPSEDTTIMTIHPGAPSRAYSNTRPSSADLGLGLLTLAEEEPAKMESTEVKSSRGSRKSLAAAPRRIPLCATKRQLQAPTIYEDVEGMGDGKENVPPGRVSTKQMELEHKKVRKPLHTTGANLERKQLNAGRTHPQSPLDTPIEKFFPALDTPPRDSQPKPKPTSNQNPIATRPKPVIERLLDRAATVKRQSPVATNNRKNSPNTSPRLASNGGVPKKSAKASSVHKASQQAQQFPVITDDLNRPELYEEHWLAQQETSLTQLLNGIFKSLEPKSYLDIEKHSTMRRRLLDIYQSHDLSIAYKRIQASLRYGALCIPKDTITREVRLKEDIGMQKKFLTLWIDSYDHELLKPALEAIVGREIPQDARLSGTPPQASLSPERAGRRQRKLLGAFFNAFFIHNEDAPKAKSSAGTIGGIARSLGRDAEDAGSSVGSWRRTVLRSLMLILILDKAKGAEVAPKCLFQKTSTHKSSMEVLVALGRLLLPSVGDIVKTLGHLNYSLQTIQSPLQEYDYHVENMATDLRDGVMLTRLVEALLYSPSKRVLEREMAGEATITFTLPDGDLLTSNIDDPTGNNWILSQHLKVPATSRTHKMYNVDIALCAAANATGSMGHLSQDISASDIVDGHREKTLSLLWALVSEYGQDLLVDWTEVQAEIQRAKQRIHPADFSALDIQDDSAIERLNSVAKSQALLRTWATLICHLHGIHITNLTTSFASSHAFSAIIDEYSAFLPTTTPSPSLSTSSTPLPTKLAPLAISASFLRLLSPPTAPIIPSPTLTLQILLFLSSRLLPLARRHRAATTIQRALRTHLLRRSLLSALHRRVVCATLARECALVVRAREEVIDAARRIQRAWRGCLERRVERLVGDVVGVQSVVRGWLVRRRVERV